MAQVPSIKFGGIPSQGQKLDVETAAGLARLPPDMLRYIRTFNISHSCYIENGVPKEVVVKYGKSETRFRLETLDEKRKEHNRKTLALIERLENINFLRQDQIPTLLGDVRSIYPNDGNLIIFIQAIEPTLSMYHIDYNQTNTNVLVNKEDYLLWTSKKKSFTLKTGNNSVVIPDLVNKLLIKILFDHSVEINEEDSCSSDEEAE